MSSVEGLRNFVSERLTAAAEEIFGVFIKTIVEYEEEIDRQRRLLDVVLKPEIRLHRIELPQQHVFTEEEEKALSEQQLCDQERNSGLDQEDPAEPPQIKEEHEELCTSQEGEQLVLKLETDTFTWTPTYMENDHSEAESKRDRQFLTDNWHVVQDQKGGVYGGSTPTTSTEPEPKKPHPKSRNQSIALSKSNLSGTGHAMHTGKKKQYSCEVCEKAFKFKSQLYMHMKTHTGERPYLCNTCGNRFARKETLIRHVRTHTGEKPYLCKTCGKRFAQSENLSSHVRTHTGEKPFICKTCGKAFARGVQVAVHVRKAHTGEKPYLCKICGKRYFEKNVLTRHMRKKH